MKKMLNFGKELTLQKRVEGLNFLIDDCCGFALDAENKAEKSAFNKLALYYNNQKVMIQMAMAYSKSVNKI